LEWEWENFSTVSDRFVTILNKMLVDTPNNRYQSVPEVLTDLEQLDQEPPTGEPSASAPNVAHFAPERSSGETLVSSPENPFNFPDSAPWVQSAEQPSPAKLPLSSSERTGGLNPGFIEQCNRELAFCIGPIASLVIEEILEQESPATVYQLVDALEKEIPDQKAAIAFRRRLLS
jgi:serine/threonine-protein kinase